MSAPREVSPHEQSEILMQALPHMLRYDDSTIVVKWSPAAGDITAASQPGGKPL